MMMPPPTQIIAAVPTTASIFRKIGMPWTRIRPTAPAKPPRVEAELVRASATPASSAFTIRATPP